MAQAGKDIAPSTRGSTRGTENAPFRAFNLLSRVSGFFEHRKKPQASTSARDSRDVHHRDAPDMGSKSLPIPRLEAYNLAESSHFQESLGQNTNS